ECPFIVSWFKPNKTDVVDFFSACAEQLRRQSGFVLSAWKQIDGDAAARENMAAALTARDRRIPAALDGDLLDRYEALLRFEEYVNGHGHSRQAASPAISLGAIVDHFIGMSPEKRQDMAAERGCGVDLARDLREELASRRDGIGARSWAHSSHDRMTARSTANEPSFSHLVRELMDTLYNDVMAESAAKGFAYLSSVPRMDGRHELIEVNDLALGIVEDARRALGDDQKQVSRRFGGSLAGSFTSATAGQGLTAEPLEQLLLAHWQILADDDAYVPWQESCMRLERALSDDVGPDELQDTWGSHLDTLQARVPAVSVSDQSVDIVLRHGGSAFCQDHELKRPGSTPRDAVLLAAGSYLDELRRPGRSQESEV
ncbi:MAG: hypothetical protein LH616_08950, partial [Ilumatobacteraceae bacterium]|nr:hypothetical protein [Ilumatobacteraceae bacterium]